MSKFKEEIIEELKNNLQKSNPLCLFEDGMLDCFWEDVEPYISQALDKQLEKYTDFLCKEGYCDADVYAEHPTAIEKFIKINL